MMVMTVSCSTITTHARPPLLPAARTGGRNNPAAREDDHRRTSLGVASTDELARPGNGGTRDRPPRERASRTGASRPTRYPAQGRLAAHQPGRAIPQPRAPALRCHVLVVEDARPLARSALRPPQ